MDSNHVRLWEVCVEGAVSYSITFDVMTKTEAVHDFVRFLKVRQQHRQLIVLGWIGLHVFGL